MNKNMKKMLIFVLLLTLMIGIASATDNQNSTPEQQTQQNPTTTNDETSKTIQEQNEKIKNLENTLDTLNKTSTLRAIPENTTVGDSKVAVTLTNNMGKSINNAPITVKNTANKTIGNGTTNTDGIAVININTHSGTENIIVTYPGDNTTESSTFTTSITTVKHNTTITVKPMKGTIGENLTLTAHIKDEHNNPTTGGNLVFKLNGKTLRKDGRFDSNTTAWKLPVTNGTATITIKADLYLRNAKNITASYSGTYKYNEAKSNTETAQIRKRNAQLTVTATPKTQKHYETITFTAKLKDTTKKTKNTTAINQNTKVLFKIDGISIKDTKGKKILTKITNNTATYKYTIPQVLTGTTKDGKTKNHTIEAVLISDTFYPDTRNKTTFTIQRNPTKININTIKPVTYKKNLTITGKLTDTHNKTIANTKLKLTINNKNYTLKTDKNGIFQKTITANKTGTNNISLSYPGNTNYLPSTAKTTFQTNKIKTKITISSKIPKNLRVGDALYIEGKFTDQYGNPLEGELDENFESNGRVIPAYYKTDNGMSYGSYAYEGEYHTYITPEILGKQKINISFEGNEEYTATSAIKEFTANKMKTMTSISTIEPTKLGTETIISGSIQNYYTGLDYNHIGNVSIKLKVNNDTKNYKINLDETGNIFEIKYTSNIIGKNNVSITTFENDIALGSNDTSYFTVYNNTPSHITIPIKDQNTIIKKGYENYNAYWDPPEYGYRGYCRVDIEGISYDISPVNEIVKATFYLKDNKNKTIIKEGSKQSDGGYLIEFYDSLVPYKVELELKERDKLQLET